MPEKTTPDSKVENTKTNPKGDHHLAENAKDMAHKSLELLRKGEEKVMHLPMDRRMIFFVGIIILIAALIGGNVGNIILVLIAIGMIYVSISENNPLTKMLEKKRHEDELSTKSKKK